MVQVFLSLRFGEAMKQGEMVKEALEKKGVTVFLCSVHAGESIVKAVTKNLYEAKLVVILGTKTYGKETESSFSTFKELTYTMEKKKPFFLIKMCDRYEEYLADVYFDSSVAYHPWLGQDHGKLPTDLIQAILIRLASLKKTVVVKEETPKPIATAKPNAVTKPLSEKAKEAPKPVAVTKPKEDQMKELLQASKAQDCGKIVEILKTYGPIDENVADSGCWLVANFAYINEVKKRELLALGAVEVVKKSLENVNKAKALRELNNTLSMKEKNDLIQELKEARKPKNCTKVVEILQKYGIVDQEVAAEACGAVARLACYGNNKELGRLGVCKAVVESLKAFGAVDISLASNGCAAMLNLADDKDNKRELLALDAINVVNNSLENDYKALALNELND
jgi:hypothetical protein